MFTSFNLKYPEYEVITPQTHKSYCVRSLNVQEEEHLKGSLVTPTKITEHLNRCIFSTLVQKPDNIVSFEDFLKNVTLKDRDALLYALFHITYEEVRNYDIVCSSCEKKYPVTIDISSTFNCLPYPNDDILTKKIEVNLKLAEGVSVIIKQPTLSDEMEALRSRGASTTSNLDILTETLIIEKFIHKTDDEAKEYSEKDDIIFAYLSLPARDKRLIYNKYLEEFGQYGITLKMLSTCPNCGVEETHEIDLVENFFRNLYSA